MAVNIKFDPSSGSQNQTVKVSGGCNPGIDETVQFQVQTVDGSKTEIINVTQEGKREVLMVSDGQGGHTEFMPSDGGTFNVVKEEWKENPDCVPANGVYVYTVDGWLVKPEEWDTVNNDQAIGVAVIDTDCRFVISRYLPIGNSIRWSFTLGNVDVDGILNAYSTDEAKTDYAGQNNTSLINARSHESSNYCAASYCYNKTLNGQHGYLPAAGELYVLSENRSEVNNALTVIGASTIDAAFDVITESTGNSFHRLWSSTENLKNLAWYLEWEREPSYLGYYNKTDDYTHWNAFPFFPITETDGGGEQPEPINTYFVDSDPNPVLTQDGSTDKSWIVGRRCLAKKTDNGVAICYLDENNSELFHDGTTPASLDGTMGQWMTDLPEDYFHVDESVEGTHKLQVLPTEQADWKKSRRVLLGVTKGVIRDGKLWSVSGEAPTVSQNIVTFHNDAVACGDGFDIIDYETHCKLAHLFYTKYADRNPQAMEQFGSGSDTYDRISGTTASLGNNDGKSDTQVAFLGVEDPYGNVFEFMSGIHHNGQTYYIYDGFEPDQVPTAPYREYTTSLTTQMGYISKVEWGEHGDMIPTELSGSSTTHYCDRGNHVGDSGWHVVRRSRDSSSDHCGFAFFYGYDSSSDTSARVGSRLQYRGNIEVIDDPATFVDMPVGF